MTQDDFADRLETLSAAWAARDYLRAASLFATDVIYVDPLRYRMTSRNQLQQFFENDDGLPQRTQWRTIVFDPATRTGVAEYSYTGTHTYHGVVVIHVDDHGLFDRWREYQHVVDQDWHDWWGEAVR